jgi:hypothetical protein
LISSDLANVAITGNYEDLNNKPTLFDGEYASLANKPTLFSGSYADLSNKPTIPANVSDLTNDTGFITSSALSGYATGTDVSNAIGNLINSAPSALDTLKELADALGNDASYSTTITNALANKLSTSSFSSTADTWLATKSTSDVTEGTNQYYTIARANTAIDNRVTTSFVDNLGVNAATLQGYAASQFATSEQGTKADNAVQMGNLASVALTGDYDELSNKPSLFSGSYLDLTNKPSLFDGEYSSLANKPSLFSGSYTDLTNKPSLFNGEYSSLANKPSLFSGSYADLTNKPTLGTAAATDATDYATAAQGSTADSAVQPGDNVSDLTNDAGYLVIANLSTYATQTDVSNAVANLVNSAPSALDTLKELADALGNDASYSTTITNALANKLSTSSFSSTADTWLATKSTTNVSEGTNQYYTVSRANTAIDARVTTSFVDNLGANANVANIALSVDGANVVGNVDNASHAYIADTANYVAGDNVFGEVGYASIANSVAVANVDGIGNIATINKDGNASNILYGNGVFASAPVTYGNSNVEVYLPTYTGDLSIGNLEVSGLSVLGAIGNITITGGTTGQVLKTDGSGNLSWTDPSVTSEYGSITVDNFTGNGVQTAFTLSITPGNKNQTFVNYNGAAQLRSAYSLSGAVITFSEAPEDGSLVEVTTTMSIATGAGDLTVRNYLADGSTSSYAVSSGTYASSLLVVVDGLTKTPVTDYTVSSGTLTFVSAPTTGKKIQIRELGTAIGSISSLPVANVTGIGNIATINIDGNLSNILYGNGSFAAAPTVTSIPVANITGLGNIATINKDGNASNILYGNGVFSAAPTGSYTWSVITVDTNATAFNGYFVDTSSTAITLTLPGSPNLGDSIKINDLAGTFGTHSLILGRNGKKIEGVSDNLAVDYNKATVEIVYSNSTYGWKVIGL